MLLLPSRVNPPLAHFNRMCLTSSRGRAPSRQPPRPVSVSPTRGSHPTVAWHGYRADEARRFAPDLLPCGRVWCDCRADGAELNATLTSEKWREIALEYIVGRLSLEPNVTAARWRAVNTIV
ncbi:MAG: hypothetical protein ACREDT_06395 [Methylocella sp.]